MATKQCFQASYLHALTRQLFMSAGAPRHIAQVIAEILINANLSGHDSHGVLHVSTYLSAIDSGSMDPAAEPSVVKETDQTLILESNNTNLNCECAIAPVHEKHKQRDGKTLLL